jgi:hypothetical protein
VEKAFPGRARKLILLTNVANIDMPTTHAGRLPPPEVNCPDVLFLKKKLAPKRTFPKVIRRKTTRSNVGNCISIF